MCPSHFRFLGGRFRASAGGSPPSPLRWLLLQARRTPQVLVENASNFRTREGGSPSTQPFPECLAVSLDFSLVHFPTRSSDSGGKTDPDVSDKPFHGRVSNIHSAE